VEGHVELGDGVAVTGLGRGLHALDEFGQLGEALRGEVRNGEPRGEGLEVRPDDVGIEELTAGRSSDAGSPERGDLDDAEGLEAPQCLADGRLTRPELLRDPGLDDPRFRRVPTVQDPFEESVADLLGEDLAGQEAGGGHEALLRVARDPLTTGVRMRRGRLGRTVPERPETHATGPGRAPPRRIGDRRRTPCPFLGSHSPRWAAS
jgi:hypothetical protein